MNAHFRNLLEEQIYEFADLRQIVKLLVEAFDQGWRGAAMQDLMDIIRDEHKELVAQITAADEKD